MESSIIPRGSVVLSLEDARALFAVLNRYNSTISWNRVASDMGTTEEVARQRYSRILHSLPALTHTASSSNVADINSASGPVAVFASSGGAEIIAASIPPPASTTSSRAAASTSSPTMSSTTSNTANTAAGRQSGKLSDLRPRALSRLTGYHRLCCFYGYRWCCPIDDCVKHTLCACDLKVHVRKAHREQLASFNYAGLVHRSDQEAEAWAEGEEMDESE